jgi:hypothetical protein
MISALMRFPFAFTRYNASRTRRGKTPDEPT